MSSEDMGRLVGGRYRLGDVLGRGGMGTVWRGEDEILGRTVAVKELRFPNSVDDDEKQRLITRTLREAKAIARIRSGSAITVFDVVDEDDRPWIVMELVEGRSLADQIREDGPLTPKRAAQVGLAVLDVLRAAHREGILHRDVKPSNVLLEEGTGRVVLTDFGIAKVEGDPSVTSTGMLVGAPSYISPERARGKPPGTPADLWSLGGLLYAAVEGRPPYDKGSAISTLTAVMTEPVPQSEHAGELSEAIYGLLVKDPDKRLDVDGARVLLEPVASGAAAVAEVPDATTSVALPPAPPEEDEGDGGGQGAASAAGTGAGAGAGSGTKSRSGPKGRSGAKGAKPKSGARTGAGAAAGTAAGAASGTRTGTGTTGTGTTGAGTTGTGAGSASGGKSASSGGTSGAGAQTGKGAAASGTGSGAQDREGALPAETGAAAGAAGAGDARTAVQGAAGGGGSTGSGTSVLGTLTERFSRRTLTVAAVVVAVLVLAAAVIATVVNGGEDDGADGGKPAASAGASDDKGAGKDKGDGGKGGDKNSPSASPSPSTSDDSSKDEEKDKGGGKDGGKSGKPAVPGGFKNVADGRFDFEMALPEGWQRTGVAGQNSGGKYAASAGSLPKIQVDHTNAPGADAARSWRQAESAVRGGSTGYNLIGIDEVKWRGYPTVADWKFTREENGQKVRVLNRGFKVDGSNGYAIMITCKASEWDGKECRQLRETAFKTFKPKG